MKSYPVIIEQDGDGYVVLALFLKDVILKEIR